MADNKTPEYTLRAVRAYTKRAEEAGLCKVSTWIHRDDKPSILAMARKLRKEREKAKEVKDND